MDVVARHCLVEMETFITYLVMHSVVATDRQEQQKKTGVIIKFTQKRYK